MTRVLIIEADHKIRSFIGDILTDLGHSVSRCIDRKDAADYLQHAEVDVIVTDLALGNNAEHLATLAGSTPVVTLSGRAYRPAPQRRERRIRLHDKPFRFADLHTLITAIGALKPAPALAA